MADQPAVTTLVPHPGYCPTIALDQIPGYPGYLACRLGVIFSTKQPGGPKPLTPAMLGNRRQTYLGVSIYLRGKRLNRKVHRLILETYVGPRPDGMECLHGPGGKEDNSVGNLRWGTGKENNNDWDTSGRQTGKNNRYTHLTEEDIPIIRSMRSPDAARKYNINIRTVNKIKSRKTWKHVP